MKKIILFTILLVAAAAVKAQDYSRMPYLVDGIEYLTDSPNDDNIQRWVSAYEHVCWAKIKPHLKKYKIKTDIAETRPCLTYLIISSKSMNKKEKRDWLNNIYPMMTEDKIMRLYIILYKEQYKMAAIKDKYKKR